MRFEICVVGRVIISWSIDSPAALAGSSMASAPPARQARIQTAVLAASSPTSDALARADPVDGGGRSAERPVVERVVEPVAVRRVAVEQQGVTPCLRKAVSDHKWHAWRGHRLVARLVAQC